MKQTRYFHDMLFRAALCLGLLWPCLTAAQEIGSEEVPEKPVWSQNPNDSLKYGDRYRALEKIRRTRVQKLIVFLETQEFTILSLVCMVFFLAVLHSQKMYETRYLIEFLVCIPVLAVIILTSTDYWNINYEEVNGSLRMWEELVRDVEAGKRDEIKNTREKEECHGEKTL